MTYLNIFLAYFFISMDRQRTWTIIMVVATVATIPLDLFLIPFCHRLFGNGALGGALAYTVTEMGILITALFLVREQWATRENTWRAAKALFAALVMAAAVWAVRDAFIFIPVAAGAIIYTVLLWLLGLMPHSELALVGNMVRQMRHRKALGPAQG
jgi:Na+-driven multidrug efflux pump